MLADRPRISSTPRNGAFVVRDLKSASEYGPYRRQIFPRQIDPPDVEVALPHPVARNWPIARPVQTESDQRKITRLVACRQGRCNTQTPHGVGARYAEPIAAIDHRYSNRVGLSGSTSALFREPRSGRQTAPAGCCTCGSFRTGPQTPDGSPGPRNSPSIYPATNSVIPGHVPDPPNLRPPIVGPPAIRVNIVEILMQPAGEQPRNHRKILVMRRRQTPAIGFGFGQGVAVPCDPCGPQTASSCSKVAFNGREISQGGGLLLRQKSVANGTYRTHTTYKSHCRQWSPPSPDIRPYCK